MFKNNHHGNMIAAMFQSQLVVMQFDNWSSDAAPMVVQFFWHLVYRFQTTSTSYHNCHDAICHDYCIELKPAGEHS